MTLLTLSGVCKRYGALTVTDDLTLALDEGEALGVIGANGAGKTTMFNLITGDVLPDAGSIRFAGADITRLPPSARCRAGIGRTYQIPHPFVGMTVFENLLVAATYGGGMRDRDARPECARILESTGLAHHGDDLAGSLRLLDRKRLELARALATRPRLLLLDEIAGGLTEHESLALVESIRGIRGTGVSVIWIEHVVHALTAVVDRLVAIDFGKVIKEGRPEDVMNSEEVKTVYMGVEEPA